MSISRSGFANSCWKQLAVFVAVGLSGPAWATHDLMPCVVLPLPHVSCPRYYSWSTTKPKTPSQQTRRAFPSSNRAVGYSLTILGREKHPDRLLQNNARCVFMWVVRSRFKLLSQTYFLPLPILVFGRLPIQQEAPSNKNLNPTIQTIGFFQDPKWMRFSRVWIRLWYVSEYVAYFRHLWQ